MYVPFQAGGAQHNGWECGLGMGRAVAGSSRPQAWRPRAWSSAQNTNTEVAGPDGQCGCESGYTEQISKYTEDSRSREVV